jgi:hypothetical protein
MSPFAGRLDGYEVGGRDEQDSGMGQGVDRRIALAPGERRSKPDGSGSPRSRFTPSGTFPVSGLFTQDNLMQALKLPRFRPIPTLATGTLLAVGALLFTASTFGAQVSQTHRRTDSAIRTAPVNTGCANLHQREPVLIYDKSGSTFLGVFHVQMSIYSDGLATYSRIGPMEPKGSAMVRTLAQESFQGLVDNLALAGIEELCDDPRMITDMPLVTVTVFGASGTDTTAHTFSYYDAASGEYATVEWLVQRFVATEFEGN